MKKTLSICMILAMLLGMVAAAIPVGATVAAPVTELDPNNVGNVVITNSNRDDYIDELFEQGYIGLVNSIVYPTLENKYGAGKIKVFSNIFADGEDIADGGKFFLLEDVYVSQSFVSKAVLRDDGKDENWVDDFTLDGCGYSITLNNPLFNVSNNATIKNVTFKGNFGETGRKVGAFSVLNMWESHGYANFENVTSEIVHNNDNQARYQSLAALTIAADNSTFKNVKVVGDHTLNEKGGVIDEVGAIVGQTGGKTVFENCYVGGTTTIKSPTLGRIYGIGGYVGKVNGDVTFKDCVNARNIVINTEVKADYFTTSENGKDESLAQDLGIGGFAGAAHNAVFENCVNTGNITFTGKFNVTDKQLRVGGLLGFSGGSVVMNNCKNDGNITVNVDNSYTVTTDKEGQTLSLTASHRAGFGGIVGASYGSKTELTNCVNNGDILLDKIKVNAGAGVLGYVSGGSAKIIGCDNNGDIKFQNGAALGQPKDEGMALGGVVGLSKVDTLYIENCDNTADITYTTVNAPSANYTADGKQNTYNLHTGVCAVGGVFGYSYLTNTKEISVINCVNDGTITQSTESNRVPFLGGVIGGVRGVAYFLADKCINNANLSASGTITWSSVGGVIGQYASIGNWMHNGNASIEATFDARGCVNNGNITTNADVGGILGADHEMEAVNLVTSFYNCVNNGKVECTNSNTCAGGIYGVAKSKGYLNVNYCVNNGAITSKSYAGGITSAAEGFTDITITNSKNAGAINATKRAGGIFATATVTGNLNVTNCLNSGNLTVTDKANGLAVGIGYSSKEKANIDKCVNSGTISAPDGAIEAPIVPTQTTLKSGVTNYFLNNCVTNATGFAGTAKDQNGINTIVGAMIFAAAGDAFHLNKSIKAASVLIKTDYVEDTWNEFNTALTNAKGIAADSKSAQDAINAAKEELDETRAKLDPKDLDLTEFNKQYARYKALNKDEYSKNSYLEVTRAVEAAEIVRDTENALQSVFDAAVALISTRIGELAEREDTKGEIDIDNLGDMTLKPLRPVETTPTATTPPTEAPTTAAPTTAATKAEEGGCGGLIGGAAIVATAVLALGAGISLKRKED